MNTIAFPADTMPAENTVEPAPRLILKSQLDDMAALWPWVESIAAEYAIPADTVFGIHLCLEEAVSNVIRHGYGGQPGNTITVDYSLSDGNELLFTVEDQAPPFDPITAPLIEDEPATSPMDYLRPGGRGILLMRNFANKLAYERLENGNEGSNRLTIGFVLPG
jgi:serine/threonine-protein kinase RsbW